MPIHLTTTSYGAAAYDALRRAVRDAKGDDPLRRVTVVVPAERVGVAARRALARGDTEHGPGIAALSVLTLRRVAEVLAAASLLRQGRRPLTGPALAHAVRAVLDASLESPFAPVAGHIGTVRALAQAHRELRPHRDATTQALRGEPVADETVRLHRALEQRLTSTTYDETDLLLAAVGPAAGRHDLGTLVVFLPQDLEPPEVELLRSLAGPDDLHLVLGLTGDRRADAAPRRCAEALQLEVPDADRPVPTATTVLHASDPDDEVRNVVRRLVVALESSPGHRIAVLFGSLDPYARLLHEHLRTAGVTFFGRGVRPALESAYGRTVLRLLALPDRDFRRVDVLGTLADGPVRSGDRRVPTSAWERASRAAGVVRGEDWERLTTYAERARENAAQERTTSDPRVWLADRHERDAAAAQSLTAFVGDLRSRFLDLDEATSWAELAGGVRKLCDDLLIADDDLPPEDASAARKARATLDALSDGTGPPSRNALLELLELELDAVLDRVGTIGVGVHVGPVSEGVGDDLDVVFILGAAEGLLPARSSDDPLLPDRLRERTGSALATTADRTARQHRHVLAALAAAPAKGRTMSFPRGDLRRGGERVPSRWLLPSLRALGHRSDVQATRWREVEDALVSSPSYAGALLAAEVPAHAQEWRQRAVAASETLPSDEAFERARALRRARADAEFTEFDGNLAGEDVPDPTQHAGLSPTALEEWTKCPHAYFQHRLLGLAPVEEPDEVVQISALERGSVLHAVWERLVREALQQGWAPGPGEPWPERAHERLGALADEEFATAVSRGVTGFPLLWEQDRRVLRRDLDSWLEKDDERRARLDEAVPLAAELSFGSADAPPVAIDLGDGRVLRLRGMVDRVDRRRGGGLAVTDYKTGKAEPYRKAITAAEPTDHGQRLQLPVYALAAREAYGAPDTPVRADYWFTSLRGGFAVVGYDVTDTVLESTRQALRTIVDGIGAGMFLPRPPKDEGSAAYDCPWCDVDGLGATTATEAWDRKRDGAAQLRLMLHGPEAT